jgi:N-acetyltransferase
MWLAGSSSLRSTYSQYPPPLLHTPPHSSSSTSKRFQKRWNNSSSTSKNRAAATSSNSCSPMISTNNDSPNNIAKKIKFNNEQQPNNGNKKLIQMHLDLGQADFDGITCNKCGMFYVQGKEDHIHETFCKKHHNNKILEWKIRKEDEKELVSTFEDGNIQQIYSNDSRLDKILDVVDEVLGFVVPTTNSWTSLTTNKDVPKSIKTNNEYHFIFISPSSNSSNDNDFNVVGYLSCEKITSAFIITTKSSEKDGEGIIRHISTTNIQPAKIGIKKIWVDECMRRKGIASRLLDAARISLGFPFAIDKNLVAISSPTPLGANWFEQVVGSSTYLCYT